MKSIRTFIVNFFLFLLILSLLLHITDLFLSNYISLFVSISLSILIKKHINFESN